MTATRATHIGGRAARVGLARAAAIGIAVGAGLVVHRLANRAAPAGSRTSLVDWATAEAIAVRRLRSASGRLSTSELTAAGPAYARAMERIVPRLEARLGSALPGVVERHAVVDRAGWAAANVSAFRDLVGHLESTALGERALANQGSLAMLANRYIATRQVGFLLSYLGTRVLGQYDIALLSAEEAPGRLLFVEENIRATARSLGVPLDRFRTWIALTRRRTRSRWRPTRGSGPTFGSVSSARWTRSWARRGHCRPRGCDISWNGGGPQRRRARSAASCRPSNAAAARDPAGDEPHGRLLRLGHGRRRGAAAAGCDPHPGAVRAASRPATTGYRPDRRAPDRTRPQAGAVPAW